MTLKSIIEEQEQLNEGKLMDIVKSGMASLKNSAKLVSTFLNNVSIADAKKAAQEVATSIKTMKDGGKSDADISKELDKMVAAGKLKFAKLENQVDESTTLEESFKPAKVLAIITAFMAPISAFADTFTVWVSTDNPIVAIFMIIVNVAINK